MLDLAQVGADAGQPVVAPRRDDPGLRPERPSRRPTARPQTVEVNAKRSLGAVTVKWQVNGGATAAPARPTEFDGGERYGESGVVLPPHARRGHRLQGRRQRQGVVRGGRQDARIRSRSPPRRTAAATRCSCSVAEDYTRPRRRTPRRSPARPTWRPTPTRWPTPASPPTSTTSTPTAATSPTCSASSATTRPSIWYTGIDDYVRDPGQTTGVSKMFDDQMIAVRDYINEGGKVLVAGQRALQGAWSQYSYNPLGRCPGRARSARNTGATPVRPARELRAGVQRLPAVLDGRELARERRRRPRRPWRAARSPASRRSAGRSG